MPLELLALLVERPGALVTRQEIAARLWTNPEMVDVERGINTAITRIRQVLNDDAARPKFIETVIGAGYRFIGQLEEVQLPESLVEIQSVPAAHDREIEAQPSAALVEIVPPATLRGHLPAEVNPGNKAVRIAHQHQWFRPHVLVFGSLLAVGTLLILWQLGFNRPAESPALPEFHQLTRFTEEEHVTSAAISPDGQKVILSDANGHIHLIDVHGSENRLLAHLPNMQPDQMSWIGQSGKVLLNKLDLARDAYAFQLLVLDARTGAATTLPISGTRARPSPDGGRIAYLSPDRSEVWVSNVDGKNPRRLVVDRPGFLNWLEWSVDGSQIHYLCVEDTAGNPWQWEGLRWRTVSVKTGIIAGEQPVGKDLWPGFMLPNGHLLLIGSDEGGVWEVSFDQQGHFIHPPKLISKQTLTGCLSASSDGRRIAAIHYTWGRDTIHIADTRVGKARIERRRPLTYEVVRGSPRAWTPDGHSLIFESKGPRDTHVQIYVQNLAAKLPVALSPSEEDQSRPALSSDGRWVLFLSGHLREKRQLYLKRVPVAGGEARVVPTDGPVLDFACGYHVKHCVLREIQGRQAVFFELDPFRGKGRELTRVAMANWTFGDWSLSPDGTMVVFADAASAPAFLRIVYLDQPPLEKRVTVVGPPPVGVPVWTASGDGWYVPTQNFQLRLIGWDSRNRFVHDVPYLAVPSRDGTKLAFLDYPRDHNVWLLER
jgi:eukaryotic-like serine/threonine-protein kinase